MVTQLTFEIHIFLATLIFTIPLYNLYTLYTQKSFIKLAKKVRFFTPLYYALIASLAFSGFVLSAFFRDFSSFGVATMMVCLLVVFITEIKKYKKIRVITSKDIEEQKRFILFAKKKYTADIVLLILAFSVGYIN